MLNQKRLEEFCYWILERERVRHHKEEGHPKPWSFDPIFLKYHFCNVRREDDRGTKERRAVVRKYVEDVEALPYFYTLSNLLNYAPSLEVAILEEEWPSILQKHMDEGGKVFHTAYVVTTNGMSMPKLDFVAMVAGNVLNSTIPNMTCMGAFRSLLMVRGLGSFLASQIIADLKNDRFLAGATDFWFFSTMGPGSKKGLDLLYGPSTTHGNYEDRIRDLYLALPPDIRQLGLHMQDLQNCLCEFSKFVRYRENGPGRRRYYV